MAIINKSLEVADDLWERVLSGELMLIGGTVRDSSGAIVKLLDDAVPEPVRELAAKGAGFLNPKRLGIAVGVALVGAAGVFAYKAISSRQQTPEVQPPEFAARFTASLRAYLDAARAGRLSADDVGQLIADLDEVKAQNTGGDITFPEALWGTLLNLVAGHTKALAEANGIETAAERALERRADRDVLSELRDQLEMQQRILKDNA